MYYLRRSLEDLSHEQSLTESVDSSFDVAGFVRENRKKSAFDGHVRLFSKKYPSVRRCDVEDSVADSLKKIVGKEPKSLKSAKREFGRLVDSALSEISRRSKDARRSLSCLKSVKSLSVKGLNLDDLIGRAKGVLTSDERMSLELCSSGHSVREMGSIMGVSFPTAWRTLNRALDKVRVTHGMKSRHRDRR